MTLEKLIQISFLEAHLCDKFKNGQKWVRVVIKDSQKNDTLKINEDIAYIFAENSSSYATLMWSIEFKLGRDSIGGESRSGRPKNSITDEQVEPIHHIILDDRRFIGQQIAKSIGINSFSVHTVLTKILKMSKLSVRWVPRIWTRLRTFWIIFVYWIFICSKIIQSFTIQKFSI